MITQFEKSEGMRKNRGNGAFWGSLLLSFALLAAGQDGKAQRSAGILPVSTGGETAGKLVNAESPVPPSKGAAPIFISDVQTTTKGKDLVVSVLTSSATEHQSFVLDDPPRLVVDLMNVENKVPFLNLPIKTGKVKQLRVRQFQSDNPKITRMVFDLESGAPAHEILTDDQTFQIVFHNVTELESASPSTPAAKAEATSSPKPAGNTSANPSQSASTKAPQSAPEASPVLKNQASAPDAVKTAQLTVPLQVTAAAPPVVNPTVPPVVSPAPAMAAPAPTVAPPASRIALTPRPAPQESSSRFTGKPLTLDLIDISLVDFFRLMAEEGGINIVMDPEIKGTISIKVVKVPWDQIFDAALLNNGLDKQVEGNLVRIARKSTLQDEAKQQEALKKANLLAADVETRIKRLNYTKAETLVDTLKEQQTVRGTVVVDERTNSLVLTDIPGSLDKVLTLVEALDIPQPQVEIEARIVSATRDFARDIGVQFGFVQGNLQRVTVGGPNTFGTIGGTRPAATPTNTYAGGNPITGRGASQGTSTESAGVSPTNGSTPAGNFNVNLPAQKAFGGLGISIGNIFDTFLLDAAITAGESKGLAKLISQPKVTAQNNSPATITQGLRFPVQIIANNTITVQFQNAALTLTVTPQITYEGNIVLDLKVENNTPDFSRTVNGIPSIRTSESSTRVLVTDGGTTVIGGILIDNETTQEERVPGLASLPVVGNVFRRNMVSRSTQEVLFFITPKVIK